MCAVLAATRDYILVNSCNSGDKCNCQNNKCFFAVIHVHNPNDSQGYKRRNVVQSTSEQGTALTPPSWERGREDGEKLVWQSHTGTGSLALWRTLTLWWHCTYPGRQWATPSHSSCRCGRHQPVKMQGNLSVLSYKASSQPLTTSHAAKLESPSSLNLPSGEMTTPHCKFSNLVSFAPLPNYWPLSSNPVT